MKSAYQLETTIAEGWQQAAITSHGTGVRFELSCQLPETPDQTFSPIRYTITLASDRGKGFSWQGAEAAAGWLKLRELGWLAGDQRLVQFVEIWHSQALVRLGLRPLAAREQPVQRLQHFVL